MQTIESMLNQLADYKAQVDALNLMKQESIDKVLTPEIKAEIEAIEAEFSEKSSGAQANIGELEKQIRAAVVDRGETVSGDFLMAVWSKPRVTWDTKKLDGYAAAHPEIERFRKVGNPSVSIRVKK